MGKGVKHDIVKNKRDVAESFYNIPSLFDSKKPTGPSFSFGLSREYYNKVFCDSNVQHERNVPGPGRYQIKSSIGGDSPKYTLVGKHDDTNLNFKNRVPPPGEYKNVLGINSSGKYPSSNAKNTTNILFGASLDKRFNYKCKRKYFLFILNLTKNHFF